MKANAYWRCSSCGTTFAGELDDDGDVICKESDPDNDATGCPACGCSALEDWTEQLADDIASEVYVSLP